MTAHSYEEFLPPRELWPDLVFTLPEFAYPASLNVARELLDVHVAHGCCARGGVSTTPSQLWRPRRTAATRPLYRAASTRRWTWLPVRNPTRSTPIRRSATRCR